MSTKHPNLARLRTRWSAVGAAVAITLGAGTIGIAQAAIDTGDRPVTVTVAAERILDTRTGVGLSGRFADATPRDLQVTGSVEVASGPDKVVVPADAIGVLVNVTVLRPTDNGFLSLRPEGATGVPTTSTVNFTTGSVEPNAATVDLNNGQIQIWLDTASDSGASDVLIDVVGYTIGHTHDDRYYTEAEIDGRTLYATVEANGDLVAARSDGATAVDKSGAGTYRVSFGSVDISSCVFTATPSTLSSAPETATIGIQGQVSNDVVFVQTADSAAVLADSGFVLLVTCPPEPSVAPLSDQLPLGSLESDL